MTLGVAAEVTVGQVAPLSGPDARVGRAYTAGLQAGFEQINRSGGVNGHTFRLVTLDDRGQPDQTLTATRQLVADYQPQVLAGYVGDSGMEEILRAHVLEANRLTLVGFRPTLMNSVSTWLFNTRASPRDEVDKLLQQVSTTGLTRVALVIQNGAQTASFVQLAMEMAAKRGVTLTSVPMTGASDAESVRQAVMVVAASPVQAVIVVARSSTTASFLEQFRAENSRIPLFATSAADLEHLSQRLSEEQLRGLVIAQVVPNPYKLTTRLARELGEVRAKLPALPETSYTMMEGFITARMIAEAVRRQGARPRRDGYAAALESMKNLDLGGYVVDYAVDRHDGSTYVDLTVVDPRGRIRQ